MSADFVLGIDLGTTNSVVAYAPLKGPQADIRLLDIPQLVAVGSVESRTGLPSFLYLATEREIEQGAYNLPWGGPSDFAVGEVARRQSAEIPDRTISGAKSWLVYSRIDRKEAFLPWKAPPTVPKVSPVTVSKRYLEHLIAAWQAAFPDSPVGQQRVVLTVPASFDASARELTRQAALAAGLPEDFVLLEEPQAAVYAWLVAFGDRWRRLLGVDDTLLVCDVGGGTTDLTLVRVTEEHGEMMLDRLAVGRHVLVGGDNMDLAMAHQVAQVFGQQGTQLDPWQSVALWHACRAAKEALLSPGGPEAQPVSVLGRGSRMIGGTVTTDLNRQTIADLLLEGFFPRCALTDRPARQRTSGFQEIGLPFEADVAVTRHIATFLQQHGSDGAVRPTHVLFNGGVFKADILRHRLLEVLKGWFPDRPPVPLEGPHDLDFAVARGAAAYGWTKEHGGVRIRGGTARAYYVGIESSGLAIPGAARPLRALCVVPAGMEEGTEMDVPSAEIGLVVGEPAHFRFFSSPVRKQDHPGDVLDHWSEDELLETDSLEATLAVDEETEQNYVPVRFHSRITEVGMLELWCASTTTPQRWKLEFSVREDDSEG